MSKDLKEFMDLVNAGDKKALEDFLVNLAQKQNGNPEGDAVVVNASLSEFANPANE